MNCPPWPLPTFFAPAGSNLGPPTQATLASLEVSSGPLYGEPMSHAASPKAPVRPPRTRTAETRPKPLDELTIWARRCISDPLSGSCWYGEPFAHHRGATTDSSAAVAFQPPSKALV